MRGDSLRPMDPILRESLNFPDEILVPRETCARGRSRLSFPDTVFIHKSGIGDSIF
jgi:hypothetical protein